MLEVQGKGRLGVQGALKWLVRQGPPRLTQRRRGKTFQDHYHYHHPHLHRHLHLHLHLLHARQLAGQKQRGEGQQVDEARRCALNSCWHQNEKGRWPQRRVLLVKRSTVGQSRGEHEEKKFLHQKGLEVELELKQKQRTNLMTRREERVKREVHRLRSHRLETWKRPQSPLKTKKK